MSLQLEVGQLYFMLLVSVPLTFMLHVFFCWLSNFHPTKVLHYFHHFGIVLATHAMKFFNKKSRATPEAPYPTDDSFQFHNFWMAVHSRSVALQTELAIDIQLTGGTSGQNTICEQKVLPIFWVIAFLIQTQTDQNKREIKQKTCSTQKNFRNWLHSWYKLLKNRGAMHPWHPQVHCWGPRQLKYSWSMSWAFENQRFTLISMENKILSLLWVSSTYHFHQHNNNSHQKIGRWIGPIFKSQIGRDSINYHSTTHTTMFCAWVWATRKQ